MISMDVDNGQWMWVWVTQQHWPDVNSYVWHFNECLPLFHSIESFKWDCTYGTNSMRIQKKGFYFFSLLYTVSHSVLCVCVPLAKDELLLFSYFMELCVCAVCSSFFSFFFANGHRTILGQRMNSVQSKGNQSKIAKELYTVCFFFRLITSNEPFHLFCANSFCVKMKSIQFTIAAAATNWPKRVRINGCFALQFWNGRKSASSITPPPPSSTAAAARQKGRIGSVGTAC